MVGLVIVVDIVVTVVVVNQAFKNVRKKISLFHYAQVSFFPIMQACVSVRICVSVCIFSHGCNVSSVTEHSYICAAGSNPLGEQLEHASSPNKHKQIKIIRQWTAWLRIYIEQTIPKHVGCPWIWRACLLPLHWLSTCGRLCCHPSPLPNANYTVPSQPATLNLLLVILLILSLLCLYSLSLLCIIILLQWILIKHGQHMGSNTLPRLQGHTGTRRLILVLDCAKELVTQPLFPPLETE